MPDQISAEARLAYGGKGLLPARLARFRELLGEAFVHSKLLARNGLDLLKSLVEVLTRNFQSLSLLLGVLSILSLAYQLTKS